MMDTRAIIEGRRNRGVEVEAVTPASAPTPTHSGRVRLAPTSMPSWPTEVHAAPNDLTKAAIFGFGQARKWVIDKVLESKSWLSVSFSGQELSHDDADVYVAALKLCAGRPFGELVHYDRRKFVLSIKGAAGGSEYKLVRASLDALSMAVLTIDRETRRGKQHIITGLISSGSDEATGIDYVYIDPVGARLFESMAYIDWDLRKMMSSRKTKALHWYAVGQPAGKQHTVSADELRRIVGYEGRLYDFVHSKRAPLRSCLQELEDLGFLVPGSGKFTPTPAGGEVSWVRTVSAGKVDGIPHSEAVPDAMVDWRDGD